MFLAQLRRACPKKLPAFVLFTFIVLLVITWNYLKFIEWNSTTTLFFNTTYFSRSGNYNASSNHQRNMSCWDPLKEAYLDRMLYEKPELTKPKKTDVMTVTPWLAPIVWEGTFNINIINAQHQKAGSRIGLTVFAIRKYVQFIKTFLETAEKFFMVGHQVNYYVLTDQPNNIPNITLGQNRELIVIDAPSYRRWQDISMRRMQIIRDFAYAQFTYEVDYLVCLDVDMKFTDHIGAEILSDVIGVIHPGYFAVPRKEFPNERRPKSAGYIPEDEGDFYYTGNFFGGKIEEVVKLTNHCHYAMLADKEKNMEALWHDESYLNRYFLYYKPTKVLSPEYSWNHYFGDSDFVPIKRYINVPKNLYTVRSR